MITPQQIEKIVEVIKTLNLNIDSQSAVEIAKVVKSMFIIWAIKDFIETIVVSVGMIIAIVVICRAIFAYFKQKSENYE